jgi:hypothetical protein
MVEEEALEFLILHGRFFTNGQFLLIVSDGGVSDLVVQFDFCGHLASADRKLREGLAFRDGDLALGTFVFGAPAAEVVDDGKGV